MTKINQEAPVEEAPVIGISRHRLLIDGEGVTTLVAFHGCPLNCKYCINPQCKSIDGIKERLTPQQLYEKVKIDDIYFLVTGGGIVFGGGEPLLRSDFIKEFKNICGDKWKIYVETSLNVDKRSVASLVDRIDFWIIDIKDWNNDIYFNYTECYNEQVITNMEYLLSKGLTEKIMVRVPSIPDYNTEKDIAKTITELNKLGIACIDRFQYVKDVKYKSKEIQHTENKRIDGGKFKCEVLKKIRAHVAEFNHISYQPAECTHDVCSTGCCPMCDKELLWITNEYYKITQR